jgi:hypothetical protein
MAAATYYELRVWPEKGEPFSVRYEDVLDVMTAARQLAPGTTWQVRRIEVICYSMT